MSASRSSSSPDRAISRRDTDARRDRDGHAFDPREGERRPEHLVDALGDRLRSSGQGHSVGEDDELVPTEASDRIAGPQDPDQSTSDHLEQLVPRAVPQRVVRVLEIVQVDEEGRHRRAGTPGSHQHLLGAIEDQLTVRQARQWIVEGSMRQEGFELLALGDIPDVRHVAGDRGTIGLVAHDRFHITGRPVPAHHAELERGSPRPGLEVGTQGPLNQLEVHWVDVVGCASTNELVGVVLQEVPDGRRHVTEVSDFVEDHRDVGRVLNQGSEAVFAHAQCCLGRRLLLHQSLLLFHDGPGHPDHEEKHERAHHGHGRGLGSCQLGREPTTGEAELSDGHPGQAPEGGRPPHTGPAACHVLQCDECVRPPEDRAPAREVDDRGDCGDLADDAQVEGHTARIGVVEAVGDQVEREYRGKEAQPHPGRLARRVANVHEQQDDQERRWTDEIGQLRRIEPSTCGRRGASQEPALLGTAGLNCVTLRRHRLSLSPGNSKL